MNANTPPSSNEFGTIKEDGKDIDALAQQDKDQDRGVSSEDDGPIMARRNNRNTATKEDDGMVLRERRSRHDGRRTSDNHSASKPKKPGPKGWAAKPIMKNDMRAKKEVIREIQSYWGKGFIKAYIPKCHRPLIKRGNGGKQRSAYREHETDPKNWLPSVLKAILMIAKLTDDKKWLKKAMNDVVRYRIKHTGNRKPQLVTTDFDVIEDMLVHEWSVDYSFPIRYKHLLVNRKDQEEDDETIDHILDAGSDHDPDASDHDDDDMDSGSEDDVKDSQEGFLDRNGNSGQYPEPGGYTRESQYSAPAVPRLHSKRPKMRDETPSRRSQPRQSLPPHPQPDMYGYGTPMHGYGPPRDAWGRPMPAYAPHPYNNGYGGYNPGFGGYGGHGFPHTRDVRQNIQSPMPPHQHPPTHHTMSPAPSMPGSEHDPYGRHYSGGKIEIKRESPMDEFDIPNNELGSQEDEEGDQNAALDAEVEALEIQLKLAKAKAERERLRAERKKK